MKRLLAALLAICLLSAPVQATWGQGPCAPVGADEYAGLKAGDVMVPLANRVYNATGSQCCWCSLETIARQLQIQQLYDLTQHHKGASGPREMTAVLRSCNVHFAVVNDQTGLRAALAYKLPVAILIPGHCCVLVGLDDSGARVLSNNHRQREVQAWPRAQFNRLWSGWGVVLYPAEGQVPEPAAYGLHPTGLFAGACPCPVCDCGPGCPCPELTAEAAHTIAETAVGVQQGNAGGSGTILDYDPTSKTALVVSAAHIFRDTGKAQVDYRGASKGKAGAWVIYLNRQTDVALLEAPTNWEPVIYTGLATSDPEPGQKVFKLGFPAYAKGVLNVRAGVVKPHGGNFLFECSCYVQSGDSGGGVFLADGSLCSVVSGFYGPDGRLDPTCMWGSGPEAIRTALRKIRAHGGQPIWRTDCCQRPVERGLLPWNSPHPILPRQPDQVAPGQLPPPKWRQPEPPATPAPAAPAPVVPAVPAPVPPPATPEPTTPTPQQQTPAAGFILLGLLAAKLAIVLATLKGGKQ